MNDELCMDLEADSRHSLHWLFEPLPICRDFVSVSVLFPVWGISHRKDSCRE